MRNNVFFQPRGPNILGAMAAGEQLAAARQNRKIADAEAGAMQKAREAGQRFMAGDQAALADVITYKPEHAMRILQATRAMSDEQFKAAQRRNAERGQLAAAVLQSSDPAAAYQRMRESLAPEMRERVPEQFDRNFLEFQAARAVEADRLFDASQREQRQQSQNAFTLMRDSQDRDFRREQNAFAAFQGGEQRAFTANENALNRQARAEEGQRDRNFRAQQAQAQAEREARVSSGRIKPSESNAIAKAVAQYRSVGGGVDPSSGLFVMKGKNAAIATREAAVAERIYMNNRSLGFNEAAMQAVRQTEARQQSEQDAGRQRLKYNPETGDFEAAQ